MPLGTFGRQQAMISNCCGICCANGLEGGREGWRGPGGPAQLVVEALGVGGAGIATIVGGGAKNYSRGALFIQGC